MNLLIPYDIRDDKRRRMIDKILSHYGYRVNFSVFEVEVTKAEYRKLINALEKNIDTKQDHIRIYVLTKECIKKSFVLAQEEGVFKDEELYI